MLSRSDIPRHSRFAAWQISLLTGASPAVCRSSARILFACFMLATAASGAVADESGSTALSSAQQAAIEAAERQRVETIQRVYGTVVAVYGNQRKGGGSGVLISPSGLALTNHHVVAATGESGWAGLASGRLYRWQLLGTDPGGDVALIQLQDKSEFPSAPLGEAGSVQVGQLVLAMGNPFSLADDQTPTVTLGIVSGVARYQPGAGENKLVYGDAIQTDCPVNPGNSGGPLFTLAGRVIGINGRISALERGRVNVGLGYAVSMRQVRNFLPDLLATKTAQHGTLDAVFEDRRSGLICTAINIDSVAARAGLQLGDRLLAVQGRAINSGNQLAGWISTFPAHWPMQLLVDRDGRQRTVRCRLTPLDYGEQDPARRKSPPRPEGSPPEPPLDPDRTMKFDLQVEVDRPGDIRDPGLNRQQARRLLEEWRATARSDDASWTALELTGEVQQAGRTIGRQQCILTRDRRFRIKQQSGGDVVELLHDGQQYWSRKGKSWSPIEARLALAVPSTLAAHVLSASLADGLPPLLDEAVLEGGDLAGERRAYRLRVGPDARALYLWLSAFGADGQPQVELLQAGTQIDGTQAAPMLIFDDWIQVESARLPRRITQVVGLDRRPLRTTFIRRIEPLRSDPETLLSR